MGQKSEFKRETKETSDGTDPTDIVFEPVPNGYKRTIQHLSAENETANYTYLRFGYITEFGVEHWWVEQKSPEDGTLYWMSDLKVLQAGDQLVVRFAGPHANDILAAYVDGFTESLNG